MYHRNICCRSLTSCCHYTEQGQIWYGMGQLARGGRSIGRGQAARGQIANARQRFFVLGSIDGLSTMTTKAGITGYLEPTRRTMSHITLSYWITSRRLPGYGDVT